MRKFIEVILSKAGYDVTSAQDGMEAMNSVGENAFDIVVADAIMPNLSGYELCRLIRAKYSGALIPCIILSGLEQNPSDERFSDAFLTKDTALKEQLLEPQELERDGHTAGGSAAAIPFLPGRGVPGGSDPCSP